MDSCDQAVLLGRASMAGNMHIDPDRAVVAFEGAREHEPATTTVTTIADGVPSNPISEGTVALPLRYDSKPSPAETLNQVYFSARDLKIERPLLEPIVQPHNFGVVRPGIYRSSYPQTEDHRFIQGLKLRTIVTLVQKELPEGFKSFMDGNGIRHQIFDMIGTKKAAIPVSQVKSIMSVVMNPKNYPLLIHCNHGKHRTGCIVGVVRKASGWDTETVIEEYSKFAYPKVREADVKYLREFRVSHLKAVIATMRRADLPSISVGNFFFFVIVAFFIVWIWLFTGSHLYQSKNLLTTSKSRDEES